MPHDSYLQELEQQALQLPYQQQLWLIECLVHHLRSMPPARLVVTEAALADMAADAEIQREMRAIERDFVGTEPDDLDHC